MNGNHASHLTEKDTLTPPQRVYSSMTISPQGKAAFDQARWPGTRLNVQFNFWPLDGPFSQGIPPPPPHPSLATIVIIAHKMDDSFQKYQGASRLWGAHAVPFMFHLFWCLSSPRGREGSCLQRHKQPINVAGWYCIKAMGLITSV